MRKYYSVRNIYDDIDNYKFSFHQTHEHHKVKPLWMPLEIFGTKRTTVQC